MSETVTDSGFTTQGHIPFPSLYQDNALVGEFSSWTSEALNSRVAQYQEFITTSNLPSHRSIAGRIIDHAVWELAYRQGIYE